MSDAKLNIEGKECECAIFTGTEGEIGVDVTKLRADTGAITLDPAYGNTGSCISTITFINGEKGILRYRGYPIEQVAEKCTFREVCYLLIYDKLPNQQELDDFTAKLRENSLPPEGIKKTIESMPKDAHPMGVLQATIATLAAYHTDNSSEEAIDLNVVRLIAQIKALAAYYYRHSQGNAMIDPDNSKTYSGDFLQMMFDGDVNPTLERVLRLLLILHADHEQNCSTSSVRMVGSSQANLFASMSAGVGALWGPLHGGANQAVLEMLEKIRSGGNSAAECMEMAKDKSSDFKLMGFGHRVYKNFDPRATILKAAAADVLGELGVDDPVLDIAKTLEEVALSDDYFVQRKLYPNVDFYSGIIYRAMGVPVEMFTVMFALGRLPGWISQWQEMRHTPGARIYRPRQIYNGATERAVPAIAER